MAGKICIVCAGHSISAKLLCVQLCTQACAMPLHAATTHTTDSQSRPRIGKRIGMEWYGSVDWISGLEEDGIVDNGWMMLEAPGKAS